MTLQNWSSNTTQNNVVAVANSSKKVQFVYYPEKYYVWTIEHRSVAIIGQECAKPTRSPSRASNHGISFAVDIHWSRREKWRTMHVSMKEATQSSWYLRVVKFSWWIMAESTKAKVPTEMPLEKLSHIEVQSGTNIWFLMRRAANRSWKICARTTSSTKYRKSFYKEDRREVKS